MKKRILALLLAVVSILIIFAGCSSSNAITSEKIIGTWEYVEGDLYKIDADTVNLEIYKGGTARENYSSGSCNNFTWEISAEDNEVLNITMSGFAGFGDTTEGFTLEKNDGNLELHSVDGRIVLIKTK